MAARRGVGEGGATVKRSPLRRSTELRADPLKQLEWQRRSRKALARVSGKRRAQLADRGRVRDVVWARAGGRCEYADVVPEVACGFYGGRGLEVDELRGGSRRGSEWLDPTRCRLTCPAHHDYKTAHKRVVLRRLGEDV